MDDRIRKHVDALVIRGDLDTFTDPHVMIDGQRYSLDAAYALAEWILQNVQAETQIKYRLI